MVVLMQRALVPNQVTKYEKSRISLHCICVRVEEGCDPSHVSLVPMSSNPLPEKKQRKL